uniref:Exosome complex exonuclease RRP44 S1 domain-containing protein n=1 Tax=Petromyzon marinus TaxID=7757 RepID=S4RVE7_PETMA
QKQQQLCNNLNYRHKMAEYAQRSSVAFHTQLFFKSKGVVSEEGFVLFAHKNAVVVLIPKYGLEGTVFFDSKDLKLNVTFDEEGPTLCVDGIALNMFDRVCVRMSLDSSNLQHQRIRMHLVRPEVLTVRRDAQPRNTTELYCDHAAVAACCASSSAQKTNARR